MSATIWAVYRDIDDSFCAGPFDDQADAEAFCGGFDDVYAAPIDSAELDACVARHPAGRRRHTIEESI